MSFVNFCKMKQRSARCDVVGQLAEEMVALTISHATGDLINAVATQHPPPATTKVLDFPKGAPRLPLRSPTGLASTIRKTYLTSQL